MDGNKATEVTEHVCSKLHIQYIVHKLGSKLPEEYKENF
jgi:hypothetical protein